MDSPKASNYIALTGTIPKEEKNYHKPRMRERSTKAGADPGFGQGGPQLLRPKVADIAEQSKLSYLLLGSRAHLRALEAFRFLMLKYEFSLILETLFLSFLTSTSTPKAKTSTFNLH